jgi:hypothetical protein
MSAPGPFSTDPDDFDEETALPLGQISGACFRALETTESTQRS